MRARNRIGRELGIVALVALALVAIGCGDDDGDGGGSLYGGGAADRSTPSGGGSGVVSVADNPQLGRILVDSRGFALYNFEKDEGGESSCFNACAAAWPPYLVNGQPEAENGAEASLLATTERSDGGTQVVYNGWPLYTYAGDSKPGDARGNDFEQFGAEWYALTPAGEVPEH